jgi:hypothetical protein
MKPARGQFRLYETDYFRSGLARKTGVKITPVWRWEASMREYEIRVLSNGRSQTVIEVMHLNDHAAIRAAKKLAAGKSFEVWRDLDCIYSPPDLAAARHSGHLPAA